MSSLVILDLGTNAAEDESHIEFVSWPHPGHENHIATFGLVRTLRQNTCKLVEMHRMANEDSSLFLGNTVRKNGQFFMCSAFDPNYLLLAQLSRQTRGVPLQQLLHSTVNMSALLQCTRADISLLADVQEGDELRIVTLNHEKVLAYLTERVDTVSQHLIETCTQNFIHHDEAQVATFRTHGQQQPSISPAQIRECSRLALQMVCDNIPEQWKERLVSIKSAHTLKQVMSSSLTTASTPSSSSSWEEMHGYSASSEVDKPSPSVSATTPAAAAAPVAVSKRAKPTLTAAQLKIAKNNKPLSSFFSSNSKSNTTS